MGGRGQSKRNYTQEKKTEALEALKTKGLRVVSRELKIPLSTLYDWKQNPDIKLGGGRPPIFCIRGTAHSGSYYVCFKHGFPSDKGRPV